MKKINIFTSILITGLLSTQFALAAHNTTEVKFNLKDGVNSIEIYDTTGSSSDQLTSLSNSYNYITDSMVFTNQENKLEDIEKSKDSKKKSFTLKIKTKYLKTDPKGLNSSQNPLLITYLNRFKDGGYGYIYTKDFNNIDTAKNATYFFNTPLYINGSKVKGEFSILIGEAYKPFKSYGLPLAYFNNNPNGRYLETEDGHCYTLGANDNFDINIYQKSCSSVKG